MDFPRRYSSASLYDLPRADHELAETRIRTATIREILEREFGEGRVDVRGQYRGANAGGISVIIMASADDPGRLYAEVIERIRTVSSDLLRHGPLTLYSHY